MKKEKRKVDDLAGEARLWDERKLTPAGWKDAPEAVPAANRSVPVSIRLPQPMVAILKEFARQAGIGYQVLLKRWLDDRIRHESQKRKRPKAAKR
jgi:hypothetical protein